jgi:hypothetical protein
MAEKFLAKARASMERRGTVGSYGKASPGKIKRDLAKGGKIAKKAGFAKAMATIARHRKGKA